MLSMLTVVMQSEPPTPVSTNGQFYLFPVRSKRCSNPNFLYSFLICPNLHDWPSQLQRVLQLLITEREVESDDLPGAGIMKRRRAANPTSVCESQDFYDSQDF